jgi:DMSO/TMAO reductase YedYZ molybdopterin-dependent catalytic subunit
MAIKIDEALKEDAILAYKMNGKPLASENGYPLRVVVPGKYRMKWAKWINRIELTDKDYKGYWEAQGWSDYAGRDRPDQRLTDWDQKNVDIRSENMLLC